MYYHPQSSLMLQVSEQQLPVKGVVHVWSLSLDDPSLDLPELLSDEELSRYSGLLVANIRSDFLRTRSALRSILASYTGCPADKLIFTRGENGKPELLSGAGSLRFNLSHSGSCFLLSVTSDSNIGVDIEKIQSNRDFNALANRFFSADETDMISSSKNDRLFYQMWVLKEAAVKARGMKLLEGLDRFVCSYSEQGELSVRDVLNRPVAQHWSVLQWQIDENFVAAVIVQSKQAEFVHKSIDNCLEVATSLRSSQ